MDSDPRLLSDDVLAECLTAISGGYCDTANALDGHIEALTDRIRFLESACVKQQHEIQQTLGKALGYPKIWTHPETGIVGPDTPGATETDDVCVGDHVAESLADEAADRIRALEPSAAVVAGIERLIDATAGLFICQTDGGVAVLHNGKTQVGPTLADAVRAACERLEREPRA